MKPRTAIIALAVTAVPVVIAFVMGFGALFWDGYGPRGYSRGGLHLGAAPLAFLFGALVAGLWWTGWLRLLGPHRKVAGAPPTSTSQTPHLILAAWFLILLGLLAGYAANNAAAPF